MTEEGKRDQFEQAMFSNGWMAVIDFFDTVHEWEHSESKKRIKDKDAYEYWETSGQTQLPI